MGVCFPVVMTTWIMHSFWFKFVIDQFLSDIYLKSNHPTPDIRGFSHATFIILLNRPGYSLAHKL